MSREVEVGPKFKSIAEASAYRTEGFPTIWGDGDDINTGTNVGGLENG